MCELSRNVGNRPHCIIYCTTPTVFRHTDLPPALGPEMTRMRSCLLRLMFRGTTSLPWLRNDSISAGWIAVYHSTTGLRSTWHICAPTSLANKAFALMKSSCPRVSSTPSRSMRCGRIRSVTSVRMRMISRAISASVSRMRLLASTMASGSIKTVFPVALSSWTMPCSLRLFIALTGRTRRPSRNDGCTSLSSMPSCLPWAIMRRRVPLILLVTRAIDVRNSCRWGEAVSLMFPALSSTCPMAALSSGKDCMPLVNSRNRG